MSANPSDWPVAASWQATVGMVFLASATGAQLLGYFCSSAWMRGPYHPPSRCVRRGADRSPTMCAWLSWARTRTMAVARLRAGASVARGYGARFAAEHLQGDAA